jgi:negative regulator of sigma E activity
MIAGRRALQVRIQPRYPGNPSKQSWLDLATGIPLRSNLYDRAGRLISYSEFRQFTPRRSLPRTLFLVPTEVASAELPNVNCKTHSASRQSPGAADGLRVSEARAPHFSPAERLSFDPALPRYLPRGYVLSRLSRTYVDGTAIVRAHFTDGLNNVSLVQWRGRRDPEDGSRERFWGPGDRIRWSSGATRAMLAGDLAAAELKRIAGSIPSPRPSAGSLVTRN